MKKNKPTAKTVKISNKSSAKEWTNKRGVRMATLESKPMIRAVGQDKLYGEIAIEENRLERFANRTTVRKYLIEFTCPEFTCLCPRSGFPDFATIHISYVPDQWCVELKALKLYINSFRNQKVFHEDVTNVILQDLVDLLDPHDIEVVGDFTVRGNIHTVITSNHSK